MKRQFPGVPILGLTATATKNVIEDVKKILNIPNCVLFKASFNRPNLFYEVRVHISVLSVEQFTNDMSGEMLKNLKNCLKLVRKKNMTD